MNNMSPDEIKLTKKWIANWKRAGKQLAKMRHNKIQKADTSFCIQALEDSFLSAIKNRKSKTSSGLIEQQKLFSKLRK